jgi:Mrp family chromosome partitioning ATPase
MWLQAPEPDSPYQAVLYTVFQRPCDQPEATFVVAVTSTSSGEGVTYICQALTRELERFSPRSAIHIPLESLHKSSELFQSSHFDRQVRGAGSWNGSREVRRQSVEHFRTRFKYTMVDCPALSVSAEVLGIAELVDGILLVVEANRTKKEKLVNAQNQVRAAGGNVLGTILNKRTYAVPAWLYRHL